MKSAQQQREFAERLKSSIQPSPIRQDKLFVDRYGQDYEPLHYEQVAREHDERLEVAN